MKMYWGKDYTVSVLCLFSGRKSKDKHNIIFFESYIFMYCYVLFLFLYILIFSEK